jgi:outer membrane biosynthesis protein TonB
VIVDARGRVKHVHVLSAFPDQAQAILAALRNWKFEPYRAGGRAVEVETGIIFGMPARAPRE